MTPRRPNHSSRPVGRRVALLAAALLAVASPGCTMCPDPFDYSGPVPNGSAPQNDFWARSNGILPLHAAPKPWPALVEQDEHPTPADADEQPMAAVPRSVLTPQPEAGEPDVVAEYPAESTDETVRR